MWPQTVSALPSISPLSAPWQCNGRCRCRLLFLLLLLLLFFIFLTDLKQLQGTKFTLVVPLCFVILLFNVNRLKTLLWCNNDGGDSGGEVVFVVLQTRSPERCITTQPRHLPPRTLPCWPPRSCPPAGLDDGPVAPLQMSRVPLSLTPWMRPTAVTCLQCWACCWLT